MSRFCALPITRRGVNDLIEPDDPYWRFKFPTTIKEQGNVNYLKFSPESPYQLLVSAGFRIQIYSRLSAKVGKTFTRFQDKAYSAVWRNDGLLLGAGSEEGTVRIFDKGGVARAPLREFSAHTRACHVTRFTADGKCIISAADDGIVRLWDVSKGEKVSEMPVHNDYCRAGAAAINDPNVFCSGGYDHMINMMDLRSQNITMSFDHGYPVESITLFPSMSLIISTGGPLVKIWDVYQRKELARLSQHTKTVTCAQLSHDNTSLLTGGLDKRVNISNVINYKNISSIEYDSPILSLDLSHQDETIAVGMAGGFVSVRQRQKDIKRQADIYNKEEFEALPKKDQLEIGRPFFEQDGGFARGGDSKKLKYDGEFEHKRKRYETTMNKLFRKFEYNRALTTALSFNIRRKRPEVLVAVLQELIRRNVVERTLAGRKESEVASLLRFLGRNFADMNWQPVLVEVLGIMIKIYGSEISESESLNEQFKLLNARMKQELKLIGECYKCLGMIESLTSRSTELPHYTLTSNLTNNLTGTLNMPTNPLEVKPIEDGKNEKCLIIENEKQ